MHMCVSSVGGWVCVSVWRVCVCSVRVYVCVHVRVYVWRLPGHCTHQWMLQWTLKWEALLYTSWTGTQLDRYSAATMSRA